MHTSQNLLIFLAIVAMAGCSTFESKQMPQVEQKIAVIRIPVFVVPNCNLPRPGTCQSWVPPAKGAVRSEPKGSLPVEGIAL
jgi:hypothetical protein